MELPVLNGKKTQAEADAIAIAQGALLQIPVPSNQQLPKQETGSRPSRALPYVLHNSAVTSANDITLKFANAGLVGCIPCL